MTDKSRQHFGIAAQFSLAASIITLSAVLATGIWKVGTMWGTVTGEHERIFQILKSISDRKCQ